MGLSAPYFSLSTPLTSPLVSLNPTCLDSPSLRAPSDLLAVPTSLAPVSSASAVDFTVDEVLWVGVPGPS